MTAWIDADAWTRFLLQLCELEGTRRGAAHVASLNPGDLEVRIGVVDRSGHPVVEGHVGDNVVVDRESREIRLAFAFELDPGLLPAAVRELEAFAQG